MKTKRSEFQVPRKLTDNLFSTILVSWLNPLLELGVKRPLDQQDLRPVPDSFKAATLTETLSKAYTYKAKKAKKNVLLRSLISVFGRNMLLQSLFLAGDFLNFIPPLILKTLINFHDTQEVPFIFRSFVPKENYFIFASILMFSIQILLIFTSNIFYLISRYIGIKVRTSVAGLIYQKSLRLSNSSRQKYSSGKILNLMSVDAGSMEDSACCLHYMFSGPVIILITLAMLFGLIGWYALIGLVLLLAFLPIQRIIFEKMTRYRKRAKIHSDERIKKMQESIYGIRVIKFYCWEESVLKTIEDIRNLELNVLGKIIAIKTVTSMITSAIPTFACVFTFLAISVIDPKLLSPKLIIPAIIFFNRLRLPLFLLPMLSSTVSEGKISLQRLEEFLQAEEIDNNPEIDEFSENAVVIKNGNFQWHSARDKQKISTEVLDEEGPDQQETFSGFADLNLSLPKGKLIAIVGRIGSGKSSLLSAMMGEMDSSSNTQVKFSGTVGYSSQQAWLQSATIRENITFGRPFCAKTYRGVLKACDLETDLKTFPQGDMTEIGEKGISLSGGQKQRVNLARLAYSGADILLMDDPLSAVDAHVAKHLFKNLFSGFLKNKTRILVTHQLHFLSQADLILVLKNGRIEATGTYSQLARHPSLLETEQHADALVPDVLTVDESGFDYSQSPSLSTSTSALITGEERSYGSVSPSVLGDYIRLAGGPSVAIAVLLAVASIQGFRFLAELFISSTRKEIASLQLGAFFLKYLSLGVAVAVSGALFSSMLSLAGLRAGRRLFQQSTEGVLRAPVIFFDTNPVGRILNRFSKDQSAVDNALPESIHDVLMAMSSITCGLIMVCMTSFYAIFAIIPVLCIYYHYQNLYRSSSRELKRLDNLSKSPLSSQFAETLTGLVTIRAYKQQLRFHARNLDLLDANNEAIFLQTSAERWAANRFQAFGAIFALTALMSSYFSGVEVSIMGLAVASALDISNNLNWVIRKVADGEAQLVSTERLLHYANRIPREAVPLLTTEVLPKTWPPQQGAIKFENVTLRYRNDLPPTLNNIDISIGAGERIGIVGRTGAGKSSMLMALFRMSELSDGRILIDDVDISKLSLKQARCPISIIPQDPVIFSGTIRSNLDPFAVFPDAQLWDSLSRAHLRQSVARMAGKLDARVSENGDNLSVGQRQLLCLARALLRQNRILVLDEATASVDLETDALVQKCIKQHFSDCTVLTIAHRIKTVADYDRVLVLDAGRVVEFDPPQKLLSDPTSLFSQLAQNQ